MSHIYEYVVHSGMDAALHCHDCVVGGKIRHDSFTRFSELIMVYLLNISRLYCDLIQSKVTILKECPSNLVGSVLDY